MQAMISFSQKKIIKENERRISEIIKLKSKIEQFDKGK